MVVHEAEGVQLQAVALHHAAEQTDERRPVLVVEDDRLTSVPARGHVVESTGELDAKRTGQGSERLQNLIC